MEFNFNFWRFKITPFKWDDLYSVQALINIIAQDDNIPYHYSLEWLHFVLSQDKVNATQTSFIATLENDRVVGFSRVELSDNPEQYPVFTGVHPDFKNVGIGRGLIAINDFNMLLRHPNQTPLTVIRQTSPHNSLASRLLTHVGYQQTSADEQALYWKKTLR